MQPVHLEDVDAAIGRLPRGTSGTRHSCYELGAGGYGSHGERARLVRCPNTAVAELWLAGSRQVPEAALAAEMRARHGASPDGPTTMLPA